MSGAIVVFQCGACRMLGAATSVSVAPGRAHGGLVCRACAATTWLPLLDDALDPGRTPSSSSVTVSTTASTLPSSTEMTTAEMLSTAPPSSVASPEASAAATAAPSWVPPPASTPIPPATPPSSSTSLAPLGLAAPACEEVLVRWGRLGDVTPNQVALAARLDRLARGPWNDEAEHKAVLQAASATGELAFVGARYRVVLDVIADEPRARAAQRDLLTLAMATMRGAPDLSTTTAGGRSKTYAVAVAIAGLLFVASVGYFVMLLARSLDQIGEL